MNPGKLPIAENQLSARKESQALAGVQKLLHNKTSTNTNISNTDTTKFCKQLAEFFIDKVSKLITSIDSFLGQQTRDPFTADQPHTGHTLCNFPPVTPIEVTKLIKD